MRAKQISIPKAVAVAPDINVLPWSDPDLPYQEQVQARLEQLLLGAVHHGVSVDRSVYPRGYRVSGLRQVRGWTTGSAHVPGLMCAIAPTGYVGTAIF
jgi:hypothetical protein